jgi:la-related protein 1
MNFYFVHFFRFKQRAIQFTPQYGDSFVELLRLHLLERGPGANPGDHLDRLCVNADPNYGLCPTLFQMVTF